MRPSLPAFSHRTPDHGRQSAQSAEQFGQSSYVYDPYIAGSMPANAESARWRQYFSSGGDARSSPNSSGSAQPATRPRPPARVHPQSVWFCAPGGVSTRRKVRILGHGYRARRAWSGGRALAHLAACRFHVRLAVPVRGSRSEPGEMVSVAPRLSLSVQRPWRPTLSPGILASRPRARRCPVCGCLD
jgi:hypothetical protein